MKKRNEKKVSNQMQRIWLYTPWYHVELTWTLLGRLRCLLLIFHKRDIIDPWVRA